MELFLRQSTDAAELTRRIGQEVNAKQRDRLRAIELAIAGEPTASIMKMLGRSRGFVQRWCYTYRDHGLDAVAATPQPGRPTRLSPDGEAALKRRMLAGPTRADGVAALRGEDARRILEREFGVAYGLSGVYQLLHRLNLSLLAPREQHRKSDPETQRRWVEDAPLLSGVSAKPTPTSGSTSGSRTKRGSASRARSRASGPSVEAGRGW